MNTKYHFFSAMLVAILFVTQLSAQTHSDVEFGYDDTLNPTEISLDVDTTTAEGVPIYESNWTALDPFFPNDLAADDPGFATTIDPLVGQNFNTGDLLYIEALDASMYTTAGVGYVNYYDPVSDSLVASGRITLEDNSIGTTHLALDGSVIDSGDILQYVDVGDSGGGIHDHIVFDLVDDGAAPDGAYGILFQLCSDLAPADGTMDVCSEPFWVVFNHNMSQSDFENLAIPKFGQVITEVTPESFAVTRGQYSSGGLAELAASDNADLSARRSNTDIQSRITLECTTTSPVAMPGSFEVTMEGSVFARSAVTQSIDLWNYDTSSWEQVDSRNASRFQDITVTVNPAGDLSRFVEPGTNQTDIRIRFNSASPRQRFSCNIDQILWTINN